MESFTSLSIPEENRPVFPEFISRQSSQQHSSIPQSFPGMPSGGFFAPNQINAFAPPWSPNPMGLRQDCSHRPNGPINYSLNQRPESAGISGMSVSSENSRDSIIFSSPSGNISSNNNLNQMQQLHKCQKPKPADVKHYRCGGCYMTFDTICKLHKHLKCHGSNGSYVYDNITLTAHPRKGNRNSETQTGFVRDAKSLHGSAYVQEGSKVKDHVDFVEKLLDGTIDETNESKMDTKIEVDDDYDDDDSEDSEEDEIEEKIKVEETVTRSGRRIIPVARTTVVLQKEFNRYIRRKKRKLKRKIKRTVNVQCPQCTLEFPTKCLPKVEKQKVKKGVKRVTCDICLKQVNSLNALSHIKKCLGMPAFSCPQAGCGKKFTRRYALMQHQKLHAEGTPFTCDVCGNGFPNTEKLTKHMRYHTEKRPWKCEQCPMCFKTKQHLRRHETTHTNETPYSCYCGKKFSQEGNLKTHMRSHSDEKPYVCHLCGKGFKYNVSKKRHLLKVHADGPLAISESVSQVASTRNILTDAAILHQQQQMAMMTGM